jgi:curved DNA-binding protein CbpA
MILASGQVSERPFARTVYAIAARRLTGDLVLTEDGRRFAIAWEGGAVVGAESPLPTDSPGRVALAAGFVSSTVVSQSLAQMAQRPGVDQLDLLAELGRLPPDRVLALRRRVMMHRASRVFALADARYELDDQRGVRAEPVAPLDVRPLIYQGLRTHYAEERLEREIQSLRGKAVGLAADGFGSLPHFGFGDDEQGVLEVLRDRMLGLDDLVAASGRERRTVLAVVYALGACDCLSLAAAPAAGAPSVAIGGEPSGAFTSGVTETGVTAPSGATAPPPIAAPTRPPPLVEAGAPITRMASTTTVPLTRAVTHPPPMAEPTRPAARPTPATAPSPSPTPASASRPLPRGATVPLGVPVVGARPRTSSAPPGDPAADEARALVKDKLLALDGGNHFAMLGVPPGASAAEVRTSYFSLAKRLHPDRLRAVGVPDLDGSIQRLFAAINQAFAVLSDPAKRTQYEQVLASGGAKAQQQREAEAEAMAARFFGAEEAFRKGEMALRRNQFPQARGFFEESVKLNPEEAEHLAMLAWTTWLTADDKLKIERSTVHVEVLTRFADAIKLSDACVAAHFYRGLVHKQSGKDDAAIDAFRRVLELKPDHNEASLELRLLLSRTGRRRESGGLFGKKR